MVIENVGEIDFLFIIILFFNKNVKRLVHFLSVLFLLDVCLIKKRNLDA